MWRPPFKWRASVFHDLKMSSHAPPHTPLSNDNNMNNPKNVRQDCAGSGTAVPAKFSGTYGSGSNTTISSSRPEHRSLRRGQPREHGGTNDRHWINRATPSPPLAEKFVLVSFNILGVDNAKQHWQKLYRHIPSYMMEWSYRKRQILSELQWCSPDIMCLQEVDRFEDLKNDLIHRGYKGIYKGRTGGSTDGCAIFWRTQKFELLQELNIEYQEFKLRHNVAQLCVLQTKGGKQKGRTCKKTNGIVADNQVVVCNIHVLYNPNRGEMKLAQVRHLLEKAYSLSKEWGEIPVVLAGDFNSTPQSPLYQFIRDAVLDVSYYDRRAISGQVQSTSGTRQTQVERRTVASSQIQISDEGQVFHAESSIVSADCRRTVASSQIQIIDEGQTLHAESSIVSADCRRTVASSQIQISDEGQMLRAESSVVFADYRVVTDNEKPHSVYNWSLEELETATGNAYESLVRHNLKLESAYSKIPGSSKTRDASHEPIVTTYHPAFMGTVDYIWFTGGLVPVKVLDVLPVHILQKFKGLPSKKLGSDHLALACEFAFSNE